MTKFSKKGVCRRAIWDAVFNVNYKLLQICFKDDFLVLVYTAIN